MNVHREADFTEEVESKEHFRQKNQHVQKHKMCRKPKGMYKESVRRTWRQSWGKGAWYVLRNWHSDARMIGTHGVYTYCLPASIARLAPPTIMPSKRIEFPLL